MRKQVHVSYQLILLRPMTAETQVASGTSNMDTCLQILRLVEETAALFCKCLTKVVYSAAVTVY